MRPRKISIHRTFFIYLVLVGFLSVSSVGYLWVSSEWSRFDEEANTLRASYLEAHKELLKREANRALDFVKYMQSQTEKRLRGSIKSRVYEAYSIAENIYRKQRNTKSIEEIKEIIKEALRPIRFNKGRGYYFAFTLKGIETLFAVRPEMEGKNMMQVRGGKGELVVPDMLAVIKEKGEGFYRYTWPKPNHQGYFPKIAFVKLFKPIGWVIGTGEYIDDVEKDVQEECIKWISNIKFGKDGYVFAGQWDGLSLSGPATGKNMYDIEDINGVKIVRELIEAAKSGGDFVYYVLPKFEGKKHAPKISYAVSIPKWQWYIGSGIYVDEIETEIALKQSDLVRRIRTNTRNTFFVLFTLLVFIALIVKLLSNRIRNNLVLFAKFFSRASSEAIKIERNALHFSEFAKLAESANEMVDNRKRAEEALRESEEKLARSRKMESLGLLAGGVAHDLNNVLSGIVSYPELILMDLPKDSKFRKPIETIQESGHRAASIVQDLLTVARGVAITKEPLNLNDLIGEYLHSPECNKLKHIYPTVTVKTSLDTNLLNIGGSHVHIRKVVMNLMLNASEAIEGSGSVTISTMNRYIDRPLRGYDDVIIGEYVVLSVSDDGSGISSDDLERIFEPFYTKKVMGRSGTGLGLSVVWNVIQDHKGYIDVTSDENGTTFELYFPITREEISGKDLSIPIKDYKGNQETILVVDDMKSQREISCKMLDTLGYKTKAVSSGEEAVEYLKENSVDLILLDMIMDSGINGRETYERIIKIHPKQKAIIVSGFAETDEVKKAQKLGAGKYIKKPVTLERIGVAVKEELEK